MQHLYAARSTTGDFGARKLGHMHRHQVVVDQPQLVEAGQRPFAVLVQAVADLTRGLMDMHMDTHVQLVGIGADLVQRPV